MLVMAAKPPPAPRDLQVAGAALWRRLVREFTFNAAEVELLHQLATTVYEISAMRRVLSEMGTVCSGSKGQPVVNPLLAALANHRRLADQLVVALALPVEGEAAGRRRSAAAKQAAGVRKVKSGPRIARLRLQQERDRGA
jgi:hypothetical protein